MKRTIAQKSLIVFLAAVVVMVIGFLAIQPVAADYENLIPIENYFISCEEVSIQRVWKENGTKFVRGRHLNGEVISDKDFHTGLGTNMANANIVSETSHGTFFGELEMSPDAHQDGGWEGLFFIQGLPGEQIGSAWLRGTGSLEGYFTQTEVKHMSGSALHDLFPDACGGNMPLGGSRAEGYVIFPSGE